MAVGNPYRPSPGANDWTARLPPGSPSADQGMAVQPYADPGYGMPNAYVGNLNQSPGQTVGGYLPTSAGVNALSPQLLMLLRQRPELLQQYLVQNRLLQTQ